MAITSTWSVTDMQRKDSDGGVFLVYWNCTAASDGSPVYTAVEGGKLRCEPDPTSPDYIPYDNLTEADVLNWVYASLVQGDETSAEAKARVEADREDHGGSFSPTPRFGDHVLGRRVLGVAGYSPSSRDRAGERGWSGRPGQRLELPALPQRRRPVCGFRLIRLQPGAGGYERQAGCLRLRP